MAEAVNRAIEALGELGATVRDIEIPSLAHATIANNVIMMSEAHAYHRKNLLSQPENFGDIVRTRFIYGAAYTAADYVQAQRARSRLRREFAAALAGVDLIAATVMPKPAAALKDFDPLGMMLSPSMMAPFNQTGMPSMSVPVGFSSDGLPIGNADRGRAISRGDGAEGGPRLPTARALARSPAGTLGALRQARGERRRGQLRQLPLRANGGDETHEEEP